MRMGRQRALLVLAFIGLGSWVLSKAVATDPPRVPDVIQLAGGLKPLPALAAEPELRPEPAVMLDWSGPSNIRTGQPTEYTLMVKNTSLQPVQKVVVQVQPTGERTAITGVQPDARTVEGVRLWELGTLEPRETRHLKITMQCAGGTPSTGCQAWVTFTGTAGMTVGVIEPKIEAILETPERVLVGEPIPVKWTVRNVGPCESLITDIAVREVMPGQSIDQVKPVHTPGRKQLSMRGTLKARPNVKCDQPGDFILQYTFTVEGTAPVTVSKTIKVLAPGISVAMAGPESLRVGHRGRFSVKVTNTGDVDLKEITIREPLPRGLRIMPDSGLSVDDAGREVSATIPNLAAGQSVTAYTFEAVATTAGTFNRNITAAGSHKTRALASQPINIDGIPALRMQLVDQADPVLKGDETSYEIRITNTGSKADANVVLTCALPKQLKFVSASGPVGHASEELNDTSIVRFEPIRELVPQTEAVFRITVKTAGTGDVRFKARIDSQHLSTSVVQEESTRVYGE